MFADLTSSDKMRSFVEETGKLIFTNSTATINLWPTFLAGILVLLGSLVTVAVWDLGRTLTVAIANCISSEIL